MKKINGIEVNREESKTGFIRELLLTIALSLTVSAAAVGAAGLRMSIWAAIAVIAVSAGFAVCKSAGRLLPFLAAAAALLLMAFPFREGAKGALNAVFTASESRNMYVYDMFEEGASQARLDVFIVLFSIEITALASIFVRGGHSVILFLFLVLFEAYFGITPPGIYNLLAFCAVLLTLVTKSSAVNSAAVAASFGILAAVILTVFPSESVRVEALSENVRDKLDAAVTSTMSLINRDAAEENRVKKEQRLSEMEADGETEMQNGEDIEKITETEREISRPDRINYTKIILISIVILLMFIVPFVPFYLIDRRKKRAETMREQFDSENNSEAVTAMFSHIMSWLESCGIYRSGELYSDAAESIAKTMGEGYRDSFIAALKLWQKAMYSDHALSDEERSKVKSMLEVTENTIYTRESAYRRFKLKYIYCLKV